MDSAVPGPSGEEHPEKRREKHSKKHQREQSPLRNKTEEETRMGKKVARSLSDLQDNLFSILQRVLCMEVMGSPILQCSSSGHTMCSSCIKRVPHCPVCRTSIVNPVRNFSLENLSGEMQIPCPNTKHGCQETVFVKENLHANCCPFREFDCPISDFLNIKCYWNGQHRHFLEHARKCHLQFAENNFPCRLEFNSCYEDIVRFLKHEDDLFLSYTHYEKRQRKFRVAVQYLGPSDNASKFAYQIKFISPNNSRKITYSSDVHTEDEQIQTLFANDNCFIIPEEQIKFSSYGELTIICV